MSREKQIKEMAVVLTDGGCKECNCDDNGRFDCLAFYEAERLYNAGYRKRREAEWIFNRGHTYGEPAYYCSARFEGTSEYGFDKFCPNCGAKMKGEGGE